MDAPLATPITSPTSSTLLTTSTSSLSATPLERSISQQSALSVRSNSTRSTHRSGTVRGASRRPGRLNSQTSSTILGGDEDKSLTSFPSLSPENSPAQLKDEEDEGRAGGGEGRGRRAEYTVANPNTRSRNGGRGADVGPIPLALRDDGLDGFLQSIGRKLSARRQSGQAGITTDESKATRDTSYGPPNLTIPRRGSAMAQAQGLTRSNSRASSLSPSPSNTSVAVSLSLARTRSGAGAGATTTTTTESRPSLSVTRNALFEDDDEAAMMGVSGGRHNGSAVKLPGVLQHADDEHIRKLIARHGGAISLVRLIAEDLARRDAQMTELRRRADERERALRKIILELGVSSLELETRLRDAREERRKASGGDKASVNSVQDMLSDAMTDDLAGYDLVPSGGQGVESTIRAKQGKMAEAQAASKGTTKGWKDYLWGGGMTKKVSQTSDARRSILHDELFSPPGEEFSTRSSSRAPSMQSTDTRKSSLATRALKLVAGGATTTNSEQAHRARAKTASAGNGIASLTASTHEAAQRPGALATIRRTATAHNIMPLATAATTAAAAKTKSDERWDMMMGTSPPAEAMIPDENYGPVEMDSILPPETQPPSLTSRYNNYPGAEYLTDPFGFIYDQRRKKRQREAQQVAMHRKHDSRTETLADSRLKMTISNDDSSSAHFSIASDGGPLTPTSTEDMRDEGRPRRWQDYLKIAAFQTELLSHTPSMSAPSIDVTEGVDLHSTSPSLHVEDRGFVPLASTTLAVSEEAIGVGASTSEEVASGELTTDDTEPVRMLLSQLSEVHDNLQREKTVRWNEFLRKVRAERRREGDAANASAAAAAEARFQKATAMMPESRITDGELIGVANWANKGKAGRAKWNEFSRLVLGGIPVAMRAKIWAECSGATNLRVPGYYATLVADAQASAANATDDPVFAEVVQQIGADIHRTLTDNVFFRQGPGVDKLNEVLLAYARRNPEVGYCQGMNLITANLLLLTPTAEDAFWILVCIIEKMLPTGYYDTSLLASRADQVVLRSYVTQILPRLSSHFDDLNIALETMTFQWFLAVFTDCLSAEALFRIWDVFLCLRDGSVFLFQVALALLKLNEAQLLACGTAAEVYTYINHQMTNHAISIDGLVGASEALKRVVRREEVEVRRRAAVEGEREVVRERERERRERRRV